MTQAIDMDARVSHLGSARTAASAVRTTATSKLGTFAITFGIAFVILYTLFERWNWPLFTYHPAINRLDMWRQPGIPEDGPPMFWYGWVVLSRDVGALAARGLPYGALRMSRSKACVMTRLRGSRWRRGRPRTSTRP